MRDDPNTILLLPPPCIRLAMLKKNIYLSTSCLVITVAFSPKNRNTGYFAADFCRLAVILTIYRLKNNKNLSPHFLTTVTVIKKFVYIKKNFKINGYSVDRVHVGLFLLKYLAPYK